MLFQLGLLLAAAPKTTEGSFYNDHFGIVVTTVGTVIVALIALSGRRQVKAVHDEVRTNHGLRAGEYLEQVAEVLQSSRAFEAKAQAHWEMESGRLTEVTKQMGALSTGQDTLRTMIEEHTAQDQKNFEQLDKRIEGITAKTTGDVAPSPSPARQPTRRKAPRVKAPAPAA